MTKHYCDRCKEEFKDAHREGYIIDITPPQAPYWTKEVVLCETCYEGFIENFMHDFDDVENA